MPIRMQNRSIVLDIVNDVEKSLENECYLSALALALTLPDICGRAEYPKSSVGCRYRKWFDEHIGAYYSKIWQFEDESFNRPYPSGELVYSLRCQFLHSGNPNIDTNKIQEERNRITKFVLIAPQKNDLLSMSTFNNISCDESGAVIENTYEVYIPVICKTISGVAKKYYIENPSKFDFLDYTYIDKRKLVWEDEY